MKSILAVAVAALALGFGLGMGLERTRQGREEARAADPDAASRERFTREARLTARIVHPHVVRVLDHGTLPEGLPFVAYELIEGESLEDWGRRGLPGSDTLSGWGRAIAGALAAVHRMGLVHRDVKPANVLLRRSGEPVLADF
ncbi:MAG: protein kinase, partial [Candidatus Brocadiae bacterium]|nr:protein kinase [Candidatus Brocadiia bacterium]